MKTFETPIDRVESIYKYFHDPSHSVEILKQATAK